MHLMKSMFRTLLFSVFAGATLASCATNWVMSPRDRSIKEWESLEKSKKEKSSDSAKSQFASHKSEGYDFRVREKSKEK